MIIREIIKSDLLTFSNASEGTAVLIQRVFCSVLLFIAFCFRLAHRARAQVLNFSVLYFTSLYLFQSTVWAFDFFPFYTSPRESPFWMM